MENKNKRVLGYTLAKQISNEELEQVSGGGGPQLTTRQTVKVSGVASDVIYDVVVDGDL
ncbi:MULTISPECIES: bacteriocin [Legionella]|uniref:Bacteriocin n=1 Tax=Legionella septentrionalis TaxID=2498109 RepID=A0A3S0X5V6_9GAMM|nr:MULTISPECIES: bacteriocin [Legionella]MCP0914743.1 bacteriocin [Legionella sp. 27cVA30]RUQ91114.1 bacteriocin [Legionella septentrionalis]RUR02817.1 bacteriocin [Legionella septentrionalis]RUR11415.1 bacteriocin [Legionella septentrionalis]RUR15110.1 bacteriocin [Legionella septentrionalis]